MKSSIKIIIVLISSAILYSCNSNISNNDTSLIEDYFEVDVLLPSDELKEQIRESVASYFINCHIHDKDNVFIQIECNAVWDVTRNPDPSVIKIVEIDTSWFYLTISDSLSYESILNWSNPTDKEILYSVKTILDTGTYSLCCVNHDNVSSQSLLNRYINTIAETAINFKMRFKIGDYHLATVDN